MRVPRLFRAANDNTAPPLARLCRYAVIVFLIAAAGSLLWYAV